jgi:hypothetical protein
MITPLLYPLTGMTRRQWMLTPPSYDYTLVYPLTGVTGLHWMLTPPSYDYTPGMIRDSCKPSSLYLSFL